MPDLARVVRTESRLAILTMSLVHQLHKIAEHYGSKNMIKNLY